MKLPKNILITREMMTHVVIPDGAKPSEFVSICWKWYQENYPSNKSINGTILENIVELALRRAGIVNVFSQVELSYVPFAIFDLMLFEEHAPIALPVKTTLRERWKQADMEAQLMKQVHRDGLCFLLTLSESEVRTRRNDIQQPLGIDAYVLVDTPEFDEFVEALSARNFIRPGAVPVISSSRPNLEEQDVILS